jgi:hypothetical protein
MVGDIYIKSAQKQIEGFMAESVCCNKCEYQTIEWFHGDPCPTCINGTLERQLSDEKVKAVCIEVPLEDLEKLKELILEAKNPHVQFRDSLETMRKEAMAITNNALYRAEGMINYIVA